MTPARLRADDDGPVRWLTLDRAAEANAIDLPLAEEFAAAIADAEADRGCRVLGIRAEGPRFCAGGDVRAMAAAPDPAEYLRALAGTMHTALLRLARSRLVTVAAVQGAAAGAGLGLVLNADLALATADAVFLSAYGGIGLTPDCGVSYLLPRAAGPRRAAEMILAGRSANAREAQEWGIVSSVVEGDLHEAATALARRVAEGSGAALGPARRLLNAAAVAGYAEHLDAELDAITRLAAGPDAAARIAAFATRGGKGPRG